MSLEAQIVNSNAPDRDSPPASEVIYNGTVGDSVVPTILVDDGSQEDASDEEQHERYAYVVWKLSVFLGRPRIRLNGPSAVFAAMRVKRIVCRGAAILAATRRAIAGSTLAGVNSARRVSEGCSASEPVTAKTAVGSPASIIDAAASPLTTPAADQLAPFGAR